MRRRCTKLRNVLASQSGFSLPELLAVVLIMTLAGMIVTNGLPAAIRTYTEAVDASNAQTLLSTTVERMRSELSVADAKTVKMNPETGTFSDVRFVSRKTNYQTWIYNDPSTDASSNKGICINEGYALGGATVDVPYSNAKAMSTASIKLAYGNTDPYPLVPAEMQKGMMQSHMRTKISSLSWNETTKVFTATVQVLRGESTTPFAEAKDVMIKVFVE